MTKTLNLSWTRFCISLAIIGMFPALLIIAGLNHRDSLQAAAAICVFFISLFAFLSLGWARLRRANAVRPILATEIDRIRQLLIGPVVPAAAWFVCTVLVIIAFAIASGFYSRAA